MAYRTLLGANSPDRRKKFQKDTRLRPVYAGEPRPRVFPNDIFRDSARGPAGSMATEESLRKLNMRALREIATDLGVKHNTRTREGTLIARILQAKQGQE